MSHNKYSSTRNSGGQNPFTETVRPGMRSLGTKTENLNRSRAVAQNEKHNERADTLEEVKSLLSQQSEENKLLKRQVVELSSTWSKLKPSASKGDSKSSHQENAPPQIAPLTADISKSSRSSQRRRFQKPVKTPQNYDGSQPLHDYLKHFERRAVVND